MLAKESLADNNFRSEVRDGRNEPSGCGVFAMSLVVKGIRW